MSCACLPATPTGPLELNVHYRAALMQTIEQMANQGNRTIAIAYRDLDDQPFPEDEPSFNYILIAIVGIQDPIRVEVCLAFPLLKND